MTDIAVVFPSLIVLRSSVAAVWLYEGLWCKILGRVPSQVDGRDGRAAAGSAVRRALPQGARCRGDGDRGLGHARAVAPGLCARLSRRRLLVVLNVNGLLWARRIIHDPAGMVVKNVAFLVLVWVCGAVSVNVL